MRYKADERLVVVAINVVNEFFLVKMKAKIHFNDSIFVFKYHFIRKAYDYFCA